MNPIARQTACINTDAARRMVDAMAEEARRRGVPGAFAIVDGGGHAMALLRLDGTMHAAADLAIAKAATAVAFKRPTRDLEKVIADGRTAMLSPASAVSGGYVPLRGGHPLYDGAELIGGLAVAGTMDADMDETIAAAGLALVRRA